MKEPPVRVKEASDKVINHLREVGMFHLYGESDIYDDILQKFLSESSWGWTSQTFAEHWLDNNHLV